MTSRRTDFLDTALESIDFLGEWLRHHICHSDKACEANLRAYGLR